MSIRPSASDATSSAVRVTLNTASRNGTVSGRSRRASAVDTANSGIAITTRSRLGMRRVHRIFPASVVTHVTKPPSTAGATLSGWPSRPAARSMSAWASSGPPSRALAAAAPPTIAAALLPRPRASGMRLCCRRWKARGAAAPVCAPATARAARYARCDGSRGSAMAPSPSISIRGSGAASSATELWRRRARPSASNPGPRFAVVAGTRTRITGRLPDAHRLADDALDGLDRRRHRFGPAFRAEHRLRIFEAVAGEDARDRGAFAQPALARPPEHAGDRRRGRRLDEDAFLLREQGARGEQLLVAHGLESAAGFLDRGDGAVPRGRPADPDRGRDGLRPIDRMSQDEGRRSSRLEPPHLRPGGHDIARVVLDEAAPVRGDVAGVPDRDREHVRGAPERVADLEGAGLLALDPVRIHRVDQREPEARRALAH